MENTPARGPHAISLWGLLAVFMLRVGAQPLAGLTGWAWLPGFSDWQSGALSYPLLVGAQLVLAAGMAVAAAGVASGRTRPRPAVGRLLAAAAGLYGAVMVSRLALGLTVARGHWWLDAPLPTVYHLGLTTFLAVYGHYHLRGHAPDSRAA